MLLAFICFHMTTLLSLTVSCAHRQALAWQKKKVYQILKMHYEKRTDALLITMEAQQTAVRITLSKDTVC